MRKRNLATACALSAAMLLQTFGAVGIPLKAAERTAMISDEQLSETPVEEPASYGPTPNEAQRYYQTKGSFAAFCHFSVNTFNNVEWGENYGTTPPADLFTLSNDFDADGIVRTLKDAGFSRLMITAKHHDGFCIWASEYTDYDISSTNYKNGEGDILEEISDACTKYNMDMGLYLSPWDIHEDHYGCYGDSKEGDYNELYTNEIREICTAVKTDENGNPLKDEDGLPIYKYGNNNPNRRTERFVEWWMDGATGSGSSFQTYDWVKIFQAIRETNPTCQIFGTHKAGVVDGVKLGSTGGVNWIGNEDGYAHDETWSKVIAGENYEDIRSNGYIKGYPDGDTWSVPECDAKMLAGGWFWGPSKQNTLRSMENLSEMYYRSIGHGATLLLNVSPNDQGTLDENQKQRVLDFGQAIQESFADDLTKKPGVTAYATSVWGNAKEYSPMNVLDAIPEGSLYDDTYWSAADGETTGALEIRFEEPVTFNTISIEEYIPKGQKISSFSVEYENKGIWTEYASGATISSKRLCRGAVVTADAIRINILNAQSTPMISNVGVYRTTKELSVDNGEIAEKLPTNLQKMDISQFTTTVAEGKTAWGNDTITEGDFTTGKWSNAANGGEASFTFTGTKAWIYGTIDPGHGTMDVYIDGELVGTADTKGETRKQGALIYTTPDLEYGEHTIRMVITKDAIGLAGAKYLDGSGVFEIEQETYTVKEGESVTVKIIRTLGTNGEVTVPYFTPSGGAEQGVNYVYMDDSIVFQDGETEKTLTLQTTYSPNIADGLTFYLRLGSSEGVSLGACDASTIVILDKDKLEAAENKLITKIDDLENEFSIGEDIYPEDIWNDFKAAYTAALNAIRTEEIVTESELQKLLQDLEKAYEACFDWKEQTKPSVPSIPTVLNAPNVTSVTSSMQGITITFSPSANSAFYEIYRKQDNGSPVKIGTAATTSFVDEKPVGGKSLTYTVKAISGDTSKYSSSSQGTAKTITLPNAPKKIKVKASSEGIKITIKPGKGTKKYVLQRSLKKNASYKTVKKLSGKKTVTYLDKKVKKGKKYYYRVAAVNGKTYSPVKISKAVKAKK